MMNRLLAIGDIHGHLDRLHSLLDKVSPDQNDTVIFLGDYLDRGPDSCGVIEYLTSFRRTFPKTVFLRGNHEWMMLDALTEGGVATGAPFLRKLSPIWERETRSYRYCDARDLEVWLGNGARETLASYGCGLIDLIERTYGTKNWPADYGRCFNSIPDHHIQFLAETQLWHICENYFFVHAGVSPEDLEEQDPYYFVWSRSNLWELGNWNYVVVHGHSICKNPILSDFEINIDTGAGLGRSLTCCDIRSRQIWQA